jgi:ferredoxin--NADP+ reductase
MGRGLSMFQIVHREEMAEGTVVLNEITAPRIAAKAKPGQFVILRANEGGERIPLTMAEKNNEKGTITIIYQVVGKSTALFKTLKEGDSYLSVIGPLGKPTHIEKVGMVTCVGGGTGVAVIYPITRGYKEAGNEVTAIIGARTKDLLILEDKMRSASHVLKVCTDDGSYGHHGFVTDVLKEVLESEGTDLVVAVGPVPMMKFTCELTKKYGVKTIVSLNPIMVDGTGMCGCCRVTVGGRTRFACVDGPEFDGHEVDFSELSHRLQTYVNDERASYDAFLKGSNS